MLPAQSTKPPHGGTMPWWKEEPLPYKCTNARNPTNNQTPTVTRKQ